MNWSVSSCAECITQQYRSWKFGKIRTKTERLASLPSLQKKTITSPMQRKTHVDPLTTCREHPKKGWCSDFSKINMSGVADHSSVGVEQLLPWPLVIVVPSWCCMFAGVWGEGLREQIWSWSVGEVSSGLSPNWCRVEDCWFSVCRWACKVQSLG